jgi:L-fuculose-phosphate aldolase
VSRALRAEVIEVCRELHRRGWVANHDGNVTARLGRGRFLCTPTATSKARVTEAGLIEVDDKGARVAGTARPFGELSMHLAIYARRDDVGAVIHAHPPHATAIACSGRNLIERPFIAEAVVSLGASIPLVPFAAPGSAAAEAIAVHAETVDAVLCGSHGVFSWGADLEQATLRLELVEHLARIALLAQPAGGVTPLPDSVMQPLLAARARAGLGEAAERAAAPPPRVIACAPAPHAPVDVVPPGAPPAPAPSRHELTTLIREELVRALRDR